ncbi:hypothetical protein BJF82_05185 [Kytococcus sp. CUA-901]|nr:hypothetical protein BJF82_05185 [Kytococcus sp. CUA-901]
MNNAKHEFIQSRQILERSSKDAITEQIAQLLDSLNDALLDEEAGESTGGDIASQLLQMVTQGHQTELTVAVSVARLMALELDIDRETNEKFFEID